MANIFQIKRRTSGAVGAPASLANGELAFNEVGNSLYIGKPGSIPAVGGSGDFTTVDTSQTLAGDKTFSSSVVLSSAVAETKATATSGTSVATTEFVQNVFSVLDGGDFDGEGGGGNTSGFVLANGSWTSLANWTFNGEPAVALPTSSDVTTVSVSAYIDLDTWVEPMMIVLSPATTITVYSALSSTFSEGILSATGSTIINVIGNAVVIN